jgi:hypothetical protein
MVIGGKIELTLPQAHFLTSIKKMASASKTPCLTGCAG